MSPVLSAWCFGRSARAKDRQHALPRPQHCHIPAVQRSRHRHKNQQPMIFLKRLQQSRAARNAVASYFAFVSTSVCGLVSIPIAVTYLNKAQMGLWTIIFTIVGYLMWLDLGIGNATGRKIAEAIAHDDQREINRWWTLSIGVLSLLGLLMMAVAGAICPFLVELLNIPADQSADAIWLFMGTAVVSAIGMPVRAYPGLLVAQERFHWVPLVQALIPWIQLVIFWALLHSGFGVRSYFPSLMISQLCGWLVFVWQVHHRALHVQVDFGGWSRSRFNELFSYSSSLAVSGIIGSVIQSLPALLLTRYGGLPLVPVYNLSNRGPGMLLTLSQRTTHSFYPNLQKLYVSGEKQRFKEKYREVNQLGVWVGLVGAGIILGCNRSLICWLAKADFFAGHWANVWFACAALTIPFVGGIANLLQYSGRMGKSALFAVVELPAGFLFCWAGFHYANLPGLAAAFALLPLLIRGPYSFFAGPRHCGLPAWELCGKAIVSMAISLALVFAAGFLIGDAPQSMTPVEIFGRNTTLPTKNEAALGLLIASLGTILAIRRLRRIRSV